MQEFAAKYRANEKYFRGYQVALIYAVLRGKIQLPDKKEFIAKCLRKLQVDFPFQDYKVKDLLGIIQESMIRHLWMVKLPKV